MIKTKKIVFITGADRGIGLALCRVFLEHGWGVCAGQYMKDWPELKKLQERYSDHMLALIPLDVGEEASVRSAADRTKEAADHLDMVINCAGILPQQTEENRSAMERSLNINTLGPLRMVEYLLPLMEEGEKRLCFFSSEASSITLAHRTDSIPYCVSKTCLNMAVRLLFQKLRPQGYRFRLYHPGWVRTYMLTGEKTTMGNFDPEETAAAAYRQFTADREWEDVLALSDINNELWPF